MTTKTEKLLALCEAATPGPWKEGHPPPNGTTTVGTMKGLMTAHCFNKQDSGFIAACNPAEVKRMVERELRLVAAAKNVLIAREREAKATMAYENALANFTNPAPENREYENAIIAASEADRELHEALSEFDKWENE